LSAKNLEPKTKRITINLQNKDAKINNYLLPRHATQYGGPEVSSRKFF